MKRTFFCLILVLLLFAASAEASAKEKNAPLSFTLEEQAWIKAHPAITLAVDNSYPPKNYLDTSGQLTGISIDYIRLLEKRIGIKVHFAGSAWASALENALRHRVDGVINADILEERKPYLNFTDVYVVYPQALVTREGAGKILSIDDLAGKTLAVKRASSQRALLARRYPEVRIKEIEILAEGLDLLTAGRVDGVFDDLAVLHHEMAEGFFTNLKFALVVKEPPVGFSRIGLRNDDPMLLQIFNKAIASLTEADHLGIRLKWMDLQVPVPLRAFHLTEEEKAWLKAHPIIRVGADDSWSPVESLGPDGNYSGLAIDYLRKVESALGVRFEFVKKSWQELISLARQGNLDLFSSVARTPGRDEFLLFTKPYIEMPTGIFVGAETAYIPGIESLAGRKVAVVDSYAIHDYLAANHPDLKLQLVKTPEEGLRLLSSGKVFAYIDNSITTGHLLSHKGLLNIKLAGEVEYHYALGMATRKDWPLFRDILQKALDAIPQAERNAIYNQWVPVIYEKAPDYSLLWILGGSSFIVILIIALLNLRLKAEVRKKVSELERSEARFSDVAQNVPGVLFRFFARPGPIYGLRYVSGRVEEIFGISPECEGFFERFLDQVHPESRDGFLTSVTSAVETQTDWFFEGEFNKPGGETLSFQGRARPKVEQEEIVFDGVLLDITEKRELDRDLRLVRHWIENSIDLFFWVDESGQVLYVNQAVCKLLEYGPEDLCKMRVIDFDQDIHSRGWLDFTEELSGSESLCFETRLKTKHGDLVPVEITSNIIRFEGKNHFFAYAKDIRERVRAEEHHRELEKQLSHSQKMEAIGTLAGGIAHDFNNILSAIFCYCELAQRNLDKEAKLKNHIDGVVVAAHRAKDLVSQILTYSRKSEQERIPLQLAPAVKEAIKLLRSSIPATIKIVSRIDSDGVALVDPTQIHQIVMNLCTNAYHAMRKTGGTLTVELHEVNMDEKTRPGPDVRPGRYMCLSISDTGIGMTEETQRNIFDPYFTSKEIGEGTGLGLAVVHGIVNSYDGHIKVDSEPGAGTSFHIYLPLIEQDAVEEKRTDAQQLPPGGSERIMFVDDEENLVAGAEELLTEYGYKVHAYSSAVKALQDFEKHSRDYDLVITDMTMPAITGTELAQKVLELRPDMPIILCSGYNERINQQKALALGIRSYLEKPVTLDTLLRAIRDTLTGNKQA